MKPTRTVLCVFGMAMCAVVAIAGPLTPPAGPVASTEPSLADIHASIGGARDTHSTPGSATDGRPLLTGVPGRVMLADEVPLQGVWSIADLGASVEVIEFRDGTGENPSLALPGDRALPALTLIRPLSDDLSGSAWFEQVVSGGIAGARVDTELWLFDEAGNLIAVWQLLRAWPHAYDIRIEGGAASEQITIVMEGLQRQQ